MEFAQAQARFTFLAHALHGTGGFAPQVAWSYSQEMRKSVATLRGESYLVRYPRENDEKFGARNAVAVYENHLRSACERYTGLLGRRRPHRRGADGPLSKLLVADADLRGNDLDGFWRAFALEARARGSMLLVIDKLEAGAPVQSLSEQQRLRAVPYIRAALPETLVDYTMDLDTGLFSAASLKDQEYIGGKLVDVVREYTATGWRIKRNGSIVKAGEHAFGACPVLPFTENGMPFPVVGKFAQVADLSRRMFNARSELDEILRSQTFSLLTLQVPPEAAGTFDLATTAAAIGTHSMMIHGGERPGFISPDSGPAETYLKVIDALQTAISRITMEDVTSGSKSTAESGISRKLRFEALNADLAVFAMNMQALERSMWTLFHRATGHANRVETTWPTDYSLADVLGELDILALMQDTAFPPAVLAEKRRAIAAIEFDNAEDSVKEQIEAAINETAQAELGPPALAKPGSADDEDGA